jgi:hypothetical protein
MTPIPPPIRSPAQSPLYSPVQSPVNSLVMTTFPLDSVELPSCPVTPMASSDALSHQLSPWGAPSFLDVVYSSISSQPVYTPGLPLGLVQAPDAPSLRLGIDFRGVVQSKGVAAEDQDQDRATASSGDRDQPSASNKR